MRCIIVISILLGGCATAPEWLANYYDSTDPCQSRFKRSDQAPPTYCGSARGHWVMRDNRNQVIGTIGR